MVQRYREQSRFSDPGRFGELLDEQPGDLPGLMAVVRTVVGYHRYDTPAELLLLNEIWQLQSKLTNYFYPQQKLMSKTRDGAKVTLLEGRPHDQGHGPRPPAS